MFLVILLVHPFFPLSSLLLSSFDPSISNATPCPVFLRYPLFLHWETRGMRRWGEGRRLRRGRNVGNRHRWDPEGKRRIKQPAEGSDGCPVKGHSHQVL